MDERSLDALATLQDPSRRALYRLVRGSVGPVSRESAAAGIGISRKLAAFHLDKLVEAGLLVADFDQAARGHRLGRPPKAYRPSDLRVNVSVPERRADILAGLLLDGITSGRAGEPASDAVLRAGHRAGVQVGERIRVERKARRVGADRAFTFVEEELRSRGYEPVREAASCLRLRNCPFDPLADQATELVCGLNHQFVQGMLDGMGVSSPRAVLAPSPGHCCVEVRA